jgi:hypothetical protein
MLNPPQHIQKGIGTNSWFILLLLVFAVGVACGAYFGPTFNVDVAIALAEMKSRAATHLPQALSTVKSVREALTSVSTLLGPTSLAASAASAASATGMADATHSAPSGTYQHTHVDFTSMPAAPPSF